MLINIDRTCINRFKAMNIHSGPGHQYPQVGILPINTTIECFEEETVDQWYHHNKGGWSTNKGYQWLSIIDERSGSTSPQKIQETNSYDYSQTDENLKQIIQSTNKNIAAAKSKQNSVANSMRKDEEKLGEFVKIYSKSNMDMYNKFNRFGYLNTHDRVAMTREYSFFTKPDLHIFKNGSPSILNSELASYPIFQDALFRYPAVLQQMQKSVIGNKNPFMNLLFNTRKNTIDLPSITSKDTETASTIYGTKIYYRKHSFESDEGHEFNVDFEDYKSLDTYMLFKLWNEYANLKSLGIVTPPNEDYIINKVLHDEIGIYKFIVDEDGETILFWAYLVGCFPKGAPRETFSEVSSELVYSVPFKSTVVLDSDPVILSDFNNLVQYNMKSRQDAGIYSKDKNMVNPDWVSTPYIYKDYNTSKAGFVYKLKWKE